MEIKETIERAKELKPASKQKAMDLILSRLAGNAGNISDKEISSTFKEVLSWVTELCD